MKPLFKPSDITTQNRLPISYTYWMIGVYLIVAWFNEGHLNLDEHFQILEFARYKISSQNNDLPWEFFSQMRPSFQVWPVVWLYQIAELLSVKMSPFFLAFITRAITGLLYVLACHIFFYTFQHELSTQNKKFYFFLLTAFSYIIVVDSVHYSSENLSSILFMLGFSIALSKPTQKRNAICILAGLLLGLSFITRYQTGFMIAGFITWLIVYRELKISAIVTIIVSIVLICGVGIYLDTLFYGKFVCTAWRYFEINLLENKVSDFGVGHWTYLKAFLIFPYGCFYVPACLFFMIKSRKHVLTWVILPFIAIHSWIGHKEMRFLSPIFAFMPFILMYSLQLLQKQYASQLSRQRLLAIHKPVWLLNCVVVVVLGLYKHMDVRLYKYIWTHYNNGTPLILNQVRNQKDWSNLPMRFYLPNRVDIRPIKNFDKYVCKPDNACLVWMPCKENIITSQQTMHLVYDTCHLSDLIRPHLKGADWMDRSRLFRDNARLYDIRANLG